METRPSLKQAHFQESRLPQNYKDKKDMGLSEGHKAGQARRSEYIQSSAGVTNPFDVIYGP